MEEKYLVFLKVKLTNEIPKKYLNSSARKLKNKKKLNFLKNILKNSNRLNI